MEERKLYNIEKWYKNVYGEYEIYDIIREYEKKNYEQVECDVKDKKVDKPILESSTHINLKVTLD
jgi:hypothetical protein